MLLAGLTIIAFAGAVVSAILCLYNFFYLLGVIRTDSNKWTRFVGPFIFALPTNSVGDRAKIKTLLYAFSFVVCFGILMEIHSSIGSVP
jgi:hypothetical protein